MEPIYFEASNTHTASPIRMYLNKRFYPALNHDCFLKWHWHAELEIIYVVSQKAVFYIDSSRIELKQGQAGIVNVGQLHAGYFADKRDVEFYGILIDPRILSLHMEDTCQVNYIDPLQRHLTKFPCAITGDQPHETEMLQQIVKMIDVIQEQKAGYELAVKACMFNLLYECLANGRMEERQAMGTKGMPRKIHQFRRILAYMEEHYQEKWSVQTLASLVNMSTDHFYKFFKSFTGMSPIEYANDLRIQKAKILLVKDRSKSVTEIALQTGFCDASYFSKQFKKFAGCTPLEFKREAIGLNFVWDDNQGLSKGEQDL